MRSVTAVLLTGLLTMAGVAALDAPAADAATKSTKAKSGGACKNTHDAIAWTTIKGKAAVCAAKPHADGTVNLKGKWKVVKTGSNTGETCTQGLKHSPGVFVWDFAKSHAETCVPTKYGKLYPAPKAGAACPRTNDWFPWTVIGSHAAACDAINGQSANHGTWRVITGWATDTCSYGSPSAQGTMIQQINAANKVVGSACIPQKYAHLYKSWGCGLNGPAYEQWGGNADGTTWWIGATCVNHAIVTGARNQTNSECGSIGRGGYSVYSEYRDPQGTIYRPPLTPTNSAWDTRTVNCADPKHPVFGAWAPQQGPTT